MRQLKIKHFILQLKC